MLNPSYLIKSRHDIYYFRYPLPIISQCGEAKRLSISLNTRCPKEALRLAKTLEYHSVNLIRKMDFKLMNHDEIMSLLKGHYSEILERCKAGIDETGVFPQEKKEGIERYIKLLGEMIENDSDSFEELLDGEPTPEDTTHEDLNKIIGKYELDFEPDSKEYKMMKNAYKHVRRNHFTDLLSYNNQVFNYSLLEGKSNKFKATSNRFNPDNKLGYIVARYLDDLKPNIADRNFKDKQGYLNYLIDWLGEYFPISNVDNVEVQKIKDALNGTPKGRNKGAIGNLKLKEQITHAKEHELDVLSRVSVNNYLGSFSSLFKWAELNKFIEENPFDGIRVNVSKKGNRRDLFSDDEIWKITNNLGNGTPDKLVKHTSYYWGTLIAVYTGARRNEIASLLPSDIKKDSRTGIFYFDINDEGDSKDLKTEAAKRIVPVHSKLIELNFLEYVEHAREVIRNKPKTGKHETRLLYDLTYTDHDKWGRKLGRWFNENYLKKIGLKDNKKSLHSLRHSLITSLSVEGVENARIKAIVGHEANTVTEKHYVHYDIRHLPVFKEAIEKLSY